MPHDLIPAIGLSVVAAAALAFVARALRQPVVLAYVAAGAIIGPTVGHAVGNVWPDAWPAIFPLVKEEASIEAISEIGLILMLFMIGLEIDLKQLARAGQKVIVSGISQFLLCAAVGFPFFLWLGFRMGGGRWDLAYLAVATAMSSTMIVVKLLYDKQELDTLAGRITVGVLVFQDIWAIIVLAVQPNLENPQLGTLALALLKGIGLVVGSLLASRYLLPHLFRSVAKLSELMLVASLAWCFLIAGLAGWAGLSRAMGALIAGIAISTFPYNREVIAKVVNIRDFFITLFFVALGMKIPEPSLRLVGLAAATSGFVVLSRFVTLFPVLYLLRSGNRVSTLPAINLAQISEFSLVIVSLGLALGHVGEEVVGVLVFTLAITATVSTYMVLYSHPLFLLLNRAFRRIGLRDIDQKEEREAEKGVEPSILIVGFFRVASSLVGELERRDPRLLKDVLVIDFNPEVHRALSRRGIRCIYGDIANTNTLAEADVEHVKVVLSTIPDPILKGTSNLRLIRPLRRLCPEAKIVVTAETGPSALMMYGEGADYVSLPRADAARELADLLLRLEDTQLDSHREQHVQELQAGQEVIP
ncbi:MAG: cation:proton antiporter [Chloroflexi bacterium]|nr:cation:proton antiporter [Chloroflexota bacterium]